jgi:hypothetical protein
MQLSYDQDLMTSNDDVNHLHWGRIWSCRPESKILPEVVSATISVQHETEAFSHVVDVASSGTGWRYPASSVCAWSVTWSGNALLSSMDVNCTLPTGTITCSSSSEALEDSEVRDMSERLDRTELDSVSLLNHSENPEEKGNPNKKTEKRTGRKNLGTTGKCIYILQPRNKLKEIRVSTHKSPHYETCMAWMKSPRMLTSRRELYEEEISTYASNGSNLRSTARSSPPALWSSTTDLHKERNQSVKNEWQQLQVYPICSYFCCGTRGGESIQAAPHTL